VDKIKEDEAAFKAQAEAQKCEIEDIRKQLAEAKEKCTVEEAKQEISEQWCRRFETGGSLSRRVSVLRAPAQMGRVRGRARRGERRGGRSRA
jgi:hypothetical protein